MYFIEDEESPRVWRRKKATRRWCKGKVGREHKPVAVYSKYNREPRCYEYRKFWDSYPRLLWWQNVIEGIWVCEHELECATCGKNLEWRVTDLKDCPTWRNL